MILEQRRPDEEAAASSSTSGTSTKLSDDEVAILANLLKALFNLSCGYEEKRIFDEEEEALLIKLAELVQILILVDVNHHNSKEVVVGNCINLLTNFKGEWTDPLIGPVPKDFVPDEFKEIEYDGSNMNACQTLLDYLNHALDKVNIIIAMKWFMFG